MVQSFKISFCVIMLGCIILFLSCNGSGTTREADSKIDSSKTSSSASKNILVDCSGTGNFFISSVVAQKMKNDFCKIYRIDDAGKEIEPLLDSVWIDSCIIVSLANFLDTSAKHDGVRIYNGAYEKLDATAHPGQKYPNESTVILVPTIPRIKPAPKQSSHQDDYTKFNMPASCNATEFKNYNLNETEVRSLKLQFQKLYRLETNENDIDSKRDSLSRSVWIDECVIIKLAQFLKDPKNNLDGVRIYSAAYNAFSPDVYRSQKKQNQSTLLMVVTSKGHNTDWDFLDAKFKNDDKYNIGAYNHGELCPQVCN